MSLANNDFGIPMPGDEGVEGFFLVTTTGDAMHVSTNLTPDELAELLDLLQALGLRNGARLETQSGILRLFQIAKITGNGIDRVPRLQGQPLQRS